MSLSSSLRGLARSALQAKNALPTRGGAGAPVKMAPRPDKPLPTWYELWWDNGYYPGQPAADFMFGAWPGNLTETYYLRVWSVFGLLLAAPFYYALNYLPDTRMPMVPQQYPSEVRDVLAQRRNGMLKHDFSAPDQAEVKARAKIFWTPLY